MKKSVTLTLQSGGILNSFAGAKPRLLKQLLIDDPLMEVVHTNLNKIHAGRLAERNVLVANTKANMMADTKETAAITTREPA